MNIIHLCPSNSYLFIPFGMQCIFLPFLYLSWSFHSCATKRIHYLNKYKLSRRLTLIEDMCLIYLGTEDVGIIGQENPSCHPQQEYQFRDCFGLISTLADHNDYASFADNCPSLFKIHCPILFMSVMQYCQSNSSLFVWDSRKTNAV